MSADLIAFITARLDEDELWAKAASAGRDPEHGTVPGGVHWTWAAGNQWDPVQADPLEPYMGGHDGQWSQPVVLITVEEWQLGWGGPGNTLPVKIAEAEELRTADGAHIARHDPARVLREVEAKRALVALLTITGPDLTFIGSGFHPGDDTELAAATLALLAAPYSAHPDYRQEWTP